MVYGFGKDFFFFLIVKFRSNCPKLFVDFDMQLMIVACDDTVDRFDWDISFVFDDLSFREKK